MNPTIERFREKVRDMSERIGAPRDAFDGAVAQVATWLETRNGDLSETLAFHFVKAAEAVSPAALESLNLGEVNGLLRESFAETLNLLHCGSAEALTIADVGANADAARVLLNRAWQAGGHALAAQLLEEIEEQYPDIGEQLRREADGRR